MQKRVEGSFRVFCFFKIAILKSISQKACFGVADFGPPQEERERIICDSSVLVSRRESKGHWGIQKKRNSSVKVSHKVKESDFLAHDKGGIF